MKYEWKGKEVSLVQMLDARENRAMRQMDLLSRYKKPLLCFTMNIAGPIKNNELIRRGFSIGMDEFHQQLMRTKNRTVFETVYIEDTGCEAYFVVDMDARELKKLTCELENQSDLGRLYDMDILYQDLSENKTIKIDRQDIGEGSRKCLICGAEGKECASRRLHSVSELQMKTAEILFESVTKADASVIAEYAVRALLYEVSTTPKPGLVDRNNSGSHKDMDFYTFMNSAAALWPYYEECALIGQQKAGEPSQNTFYALRNIGKKAENRMLRATRGVNTHKGAIFSLGIVAAAAGRVGVRTLFSESDRTMSELILNECKEMTQGLVSHDFEGCTLQNAKTVGEQLFAEYGITGIRGQMEAGLPAVSEYGLPLLKRLLLEGKSKDEAGISVLMEIIAHTTDTNLIHRSNVDVQRSEAARAEELLEKTPGRCLDITLLEEIDQDYISKNLSPGGSADLLAVCWFLYTLDETHRRIRRG